MTPTPPHTVPGADGVTGTVHVVRHGEVYNPDKILYGRLPGYHLSEHGRDQVARTAEFLAEFDLGYLTSSPLERAIETATPIGELSGLDIHRDERLIEAGNDFQGQAVAGGSRQIFSPRNWPKLRNPLTPSWGEPYEEIAARMMAAVIDAIGKADGRQAACVSHQLPIVALRRFVLGQHLWHHPNRRECALASVTTLEFVDGDVSVSYAEPAGATPKDAIPGA